MYSQCELSLLAKTVFPNVTTFSFHSALAYVAHSQNLNTKSLKMEGYKEKGKTEELCDCRLVKMRSALSYGT